MNFPKLCTPALIYFVLSVFSVLVLITQGVMAFTLIVKVVFILLWTWLLNFLCNKGFGIISWILVVLPFVFLLGMVASSYEVLKIQQKQIQIQQPKP
jgi:hypothetical protein